MFWRAPARRYQVLAIRDFRVLLADRLLAPFSNGFSLVGVSFAVLKVTGSTADLSYVIAAQAARGWPGPAGTAAAAAAGCRADERILAATWNVRPGA
jgi:hypothetical protein